MRVLPLNEMKGGDTGLIYEIRGGFGFVRRMESMNIRIGKRIVKLNSIFRRGPVTVQIGNTRMALGFGMANKIFVDVQKR